MPTGPGTYGTTRGRPPKSISTRLKPDKPLANRPLDNKSSPIKNVLANRQITRRT
jgi:hypothetical protein